MKEVSTMNCLTCEVKKLEQNENLKEIYYEIKAIADELSKDYADNQVTQMLSMGIVRKL